MVQMIRTRKKGLNSSFDDAIIINSQTYIDYLERMKKIALSMFDWINLPDTMNARYLEMCLYYKGQAALLYDADYGFINTQAADSGYINIYGLPTKINCFSYSYNEMRELYVPNTNLPAEEECILVMNNYQRVPTASTISLYAERLTDAQRAADINIKAQKTPILLLTDKNQELTLRNIYAQYDGNSPVIYGDKNLLADKPIDSINTQADFIANDIRAYMKEIWNDFLTFLGISNLDEKRERLVTKEADSNNELINMNMQSYLIPRKQACKEFNDKFGLTGTSKAIDVKLRSDLYNVIKENESIIKSYEDSEVDNG
ncbi:MAG: hypothetical protein IKY26_04075 [Erysipelotrichaceae bacterium]|nr:hypothetical protein [Erysipelotrichaceae bacterium]